MADFNENLAKCPQLVIYLLLSIISLVTSLIVTNSTLEDGENKKQTDINVFSHVVSMFLMCLLFYFLCAYEYQTAAWILLLFPLLIFVFIMIWIFGIIAVTGEKKKKEEEKTEEEKKESLKAYEPTNNLAKF